MDKHDQDVRDYNAGLGKTSRRKAVKTIVGGVTALAAYHVMPAKWGTPLIEQVFLPAHAATSGYTDDPDAVGTVTAGDVDICVEDSNAIQDDFFDLYVNDVFIGAVNNPPGGTTCHTATILPGGNLVELRLTTPQGSGTFLSVDVNGEFVDDFAGTQDHSWILNGS